jgi:UDP-N-acetylmuramate dehydrogenase
MDIKKSYIEIRKLLGDNRVITDVKLSKYSSFQIGGHADLFFKAQSKDDLVKAVMFSRELKIPYFILGGGTNILISDKGFRGIVIKNDASGIKLIGVRGKKSPSDSNKQTNIRVFFLEVESGISVNRVVRYCLDQGWMGLEHFLGQPGSIGGALWINAHNMKAGKFIGDNLYKAKILDSNNKINDVDPTYFKFGYDHSSLQKTGDIVLSAVFSLSPKDPKILWETGQEILDYRRKTQPKGAHTSGCTFRNISYADALRISSPKFTCSAGFLIDSVGLKGKEIGGAYFSETHANFIINKGNATSDHVLELINTAKQKVKAKYNITLCEEIVLVGEFD